MAFDRKAFMDKHYKENSSTEKASKKPKQESKEPAARE
jgi:hypothetical protein